MPALRPQLEGKNRDPRWIGRKVGRNLEGITRGLSYGAGDVELEEPVGGNLESPSDMGEEEFTSGLSSEEVPESVTPPLSSTKPQYPHAKPLTGFRKFADALGGGRVGAQVANINARSGLAEAADVARTNLQSSKFQQDKLMEGVKSGNAADLATLKQHLDTLQAVGLPYSPENLEFVIKMQQQPTSFTPTSLGEEAVASGFRKQGATNDLNKANALEATARASKITNEQNPEMLVEELRGKKAATDYKLEEMNRLRGQNDFGYPIDMTGGFLRKTPTGVEPFIYEKTQPGYFDIQKAMQPGAKAVDAFMPPVGGGLKKIDFEEKKPATPGATEWEDETYRYRKLPDGTVQRKLK